MKSDKPATDQAGDRRAAIRRVRGILKGSGALQLLIEERRRNLEREEAKAEMWASRMREADRKKAGR